MASQTFLNLNSDRQIEIYETAMEEFVKYSYKEASFNRIIHRCGIAKGSFYRYFDGKQELFNDLVSFTSLNSINNFNEAFKSPVNDIFLAWKNFYFLVYDYDQIKPLYTGFLYLASSSLDYFMQENKDRLIEKIKSILTEHQKMNPVDANLDPEFLAYLILKINNSVLEYIAYHYKIDLRQRATDNLPLFAISKEELGHVVDKFIYFMKKGTDAL